MTDVAHDALRAIYHEATTDISGINRDEALDLISSIARQARDALEDAGEPLTAPPGPRRVTGESLERLRAIQLDHDLNSLEEALELAITLCPERYSDE